LLEARAKANQQVAGREKLRQNFAEAMETRQTIADLAGVSRETVRKAEVILYAGGSNKHGKARTHDDKRRAVDRLLDDDDWWQWSDGQIAKHCGVAQSFVSKRRRQHPSYLGDKMDIRTVQRGGLTYAMDTSRVGQRGEAVRWIINNQLGRRNLAPLQKDELIGRRFELEKKAEGRPEKLPKSLGVSQPEGETAERLAKELHVSRGMIENDAAFVKGLDALKTIREDLPRSVVTKRSQPKTKGKKAAGPKVTKARVITVGKLIKDQKVTPPPFMRRGEWEDFQILEALPLRAPAAHTRLLVEVLQGGLDGLAGIGEPATAGADLRS
jgi:hypothetical protein